MYVNNGNMRHLAISVDVWYHYSLNAGSEGWQEKHLPRFGWSGMQAWKSLWWALLTMGLCNSLSLYQRAPLPNILLDNTVSVITDMQIIPMVSA
jgi:hypothetical protein